MQGMRVSHPSGIIARMDTPQAPAASPDSGSADTPAQAPADTVGAPLQAHLKAMADAERSVAATDDVVAQAVHGPATAQG